MLCLSGAASQWYRGCPLAYIFVLLLLLLWDRSTLKFNVIFRLDLQQYGKRGYRSRFDGKIQDDFQSGEIEGVLIV
jgi:hypothetical protein